jgi:glyoxylase-like metal-dependent hydrolase (beta-lactamase superfamily II)
MKVRCIYGIDYDSNIYVAQGKHPTIVDCGTGLHHEYVADEIKKIIDPTEIQQIILTHEHYDHCGGVRKILGLTGNKVKIIAHTEASSKIEKGESDFAKKIGRAHV